MFIVVFTGEYFRSVPPGVQVGDIVNGEQVLRVLPGLWDTQDAFWHWFTGGGFQRWIGLGEN